MHLFRIGYYTICTDNVYGTNVLNGTELMCICTAHASRQTSNTMCIEEKNKANKCCALCIVFNNSIPLTDSFQLYSSVRFWWNRFCVALRLLNSDIVASPSSSLSLVLSSSSLSRTQFFTLIYSLFVSPFQFSNNILFHFRTIMSFYIYLHVKI